MWPVCNWKSFFFFSIKFIVLEGQSLSYTLKWKGVGMESQLWLGDNQAYHNYESHVSPFSPPLDGGSLKGQAIPACYKHAPQYDPKNIWAVREAEESERGQLATRSTKAGG